MIEIVVYETPSGKEPFVSFLNETTDIRDRARIMSRLDRIESGNLGDARSLGEGLHEFRFFFGPGYRIYFGMIGQKLVILLCGGDKKPQEKDIRTARSYWEQFKESQK